MTRLRNKNRAAKDPEDFSRNSHSNQQRMPKTYPMRRRPDFFESFFYKNWKQQSLVTVGDSSAVMASVVLIGQMLAVVGLGLFAGINETSTYIVPAIAAAGYTVASVNNAFDRNLHGLVAFLDSPFMIMAIVVMLITSLTTGPSGFFSCLAYFACCLPFFADFGLSMGTTYSRITSGGATVTEITPENEEAFISADGPRQRQRESEEEKPMVSPSERVVPSVIREIEPVYNLLTSDWKENAVATGNTTAKQLTAFATIAAFLLSGGMAVEAGNPTLGAVALTYGSSSLLGYFGLADAPALKLVRANMVSLMVALMALLTMLTSGMSMPLVALTMISGFDAFQGAYNENREERHANRGDFEQTEREETEDGPIVGFFTDSWRVNSFHKKNYDTCQVVQILMFGAQLYVALICAINGGPISLLSVIILMIIAGSFSFFQPMKVKAINAVQSNGAQLAVLGAATHQIVTESPLTSFYILFCLLAADTMMSCMTFFATHQRQITSGAASSMGLLEKGGSMGGGSRGGDGDQGDYSRQL